MVHIILLDVSMVTISSLSKFEVETKPPNLVSQFCTFHSSPVVVMMLGSPTGINPHVGPLSSFIIIVIIHFFLNFYHFYHFITLRLDERVHNDIDKVIL